MSRGIDDEIKENINGHNWHPFHEPEGCSTKAERKYFMLSFLASIRTSRSHRSISSLLVGGQAGK